MLKILSYKIVENSRNSKYENHYFQNFNIFVSFVI